MKISSVLKNHRNELLAFVIFLVGSALGMLGLIQKVPLVLGILGIVILASGLFFFCIQFTSEKVYKQYYKDSYEIEHETIEDEIRKSMRYHRYQEAVLDEQKDWLLDLLMAEKRKVDEELKAAGGGHI